MNPRHRRLLIPGLLLALLVVVVVASVAGRADASTGEESDEGPVTVSVIDDPRVVEASGMAISAVDDDLVYVVDDSGQAQEIHAVQISTGAVVGTTVVGGGTWRDTEALSIDDDGTLWVADTGDNFVDRDDVALYSLPEPGRGDGSVTAERHPIDYADGPHDVEALLVQPGTGTKYLVSKGFVGGALYELPADLGTTSTTTAEQVGARAPAVVTDGAFTPDGERLLLRTYGDVRELDPTDFSEVREVATPPLRQSETLAVEPDGLSFLVGSEGESSPLVRVPLPSGPVPTATPEPTADPTPVPIDDDGVPRSSQGFAGRSWFGVAALMALLGGVCVWMARGR